MRSTVPGGLRAANAAFAALELALYRRRVALLWLAFAILVLWLLRPAVINETSYAMSEFLINYAGGPVRRGLSGVVPLGLHDIFGGPTAFWAWLTLSVMGAIVWTLSIRLFLRLPDDVRWLPFILAPGGLLFMAYDFSGGLRKECLGYIALLLVLHAGLSKDRAALRRGTGLAAIVFLVSILAHEAVLFLWPALALGLALAAFAFREERVWLCAMAGLTAVGGSALFLWLVNLPPPDLDAICARSGMDPCGRALSALGTGLEHSLARVRDEHPPAHWAQAVCLLALALVPIAGLRPRGLPKAAVLAGVAFPILAVLPLFVVAVD